MIQMKNKKMLKKCIVVVAAVCVLCSSAYLVYDLLWMPKHFEKLNNEIISAENSAQSENYNVDSSVQKKFRYIKNKYPDFAGRLVIEGLGVDFPVVQGSDNTYYLKHTLDGKTDKHGTLFADCNNNLRELNGNTVIYGHNMKDNTQFGMLNYYKDVSGYKDCPVVTFSTIYKDYQWKIFAAFLINTKPEDDNGYVFNYTATDFSSEKEFSEFYNEVMERSYFITDTDVSYGDKILTMSTCSTLFDNSRLVVMARLVREGESAETDTSSAYQNESQRFPAAFENNK